MLCVFWQLISFTFCVYVHFNMFNFTEIFIIDYYNNLNGKYLVVW